MKKFLSVVSLLLVAIMVLATPAVSAAENEWTAPEGANVYTAKYMSVLSPTVDGYIEDGEYGDCLVKVTEPVAASNDTWGTTWETKEYDKNLRDKSMELYVAHDADNIYIAIHEVGGEQQDDGNYVFRNNLAFQLGFDLGNANSYFQFGGFQTNDQWKKLTYFKSGKLALSSVKADGLVDELMVRKYDGFKDEDVAFGDFSLGNGNINVFGGQWTTTVEFKISKETLKEVVKADFGVELESIDAMWFGLLATTYKGTSTAGTVGSQVWKWFGTTDISGKQDNYAAYGITSASWRERAEFKVDSLFDVILFEDAPVETEAPTTEAPVTEAPAGDVTEAPTGDVTEAPAGDVTETPATEPTNSGCGASVTLAGLALVAALGTCTAFVAKKKED